MWAPSAVGEIHIACVHTATPYNAGSTKWLLQCGYNAHPISKHKHLLSESFSLNFPQPWPPWHASKEFWWDTEHSVENGVYYRVKCSLKGWVYSDLMGHWGGKHSGREGESGHRGQCTSPHFQTDFMQFLKVSGTDIFLRSIFQSIRLTGPFGLTLRKERHAFVLCQKPWLDSNLKVFVAVESPPSHVSTQVQRQWLRSHSSD